MNLVENIDYYWKDGKMTLTAAYLLKRGYCCKLGCKHCPYETYEDADASELLRYRIRQSSGEDLL